LFFDGKLEKETRCGSKSFIACKISWTAHLTREAGKPPLLESNLIYWSLCCLVAKGRSGKQNVHKGAPHHTAFPVHCMGPYGAHHALQID